LSRAPTITSQQAEISATPDWKATFPRIACGEPGQRKIAETALRDPLVIEPQRQDGTELAARMTMCDISL